MADARAEILARIRAGLGAAGASDAAYDDLPRAYRRSGALGASGRTELFLDRLHDYDAEVHAVDEPYVHTAVAAVLTHANEQTLLVPPGIPEAWLPGGFEILRDDPAVSNEALTRAQAVLTQCAVAIAETGTIVLQHGPAQGRRVLTLLPDHHICVVRAGQIVETVSEAFARVNPTAPLTTLSGPSATADIEMVRIRGVHGPRRLTVLLLP